jgi:hypothetical protein
LEVGMDCRSRRPGYVCDYVGDPYVVLSVVIREAEIGQWEGELIAT